MQQRTAVLDSSSGDGFLSLDELTNGFRRVNEENPNMVTEMSVAEMNILHDLLDGDGDGDLSFKELKSWLEQSHTSTTHRSRRTIINGINFKHHTHSIGQWNSFIGN